MLSRLTIAQRIWLIAIVALAVFASTFLYQTFQKRTALLTAKQDKLVAVVETAYGIVESAHARVQAGELNETEAQAQAMAAVGQLRYQGTEYFWINDMGPTMVMHPIKPALDGKDLSTIKDPNGKALFTAFVAKVRSEGAGFVDYFWPKPGHEEPVAKLSYVKGFQPWGWIVGSGVYIDDVDQEFAADLKSNSIVLGLLLLTLGAAFYGIIRAVVRPLEATSLAMQEIAKGDGDLTVRMPVKGRDELASLASGFNAFADKVQAVVNNVRSYGDRVVTSAEQLAVVTEQSNGALQSHKDETHQVATAVTEMSATIQEVAQNAAQAAQAVQDAQQKALAGKTVVDGSVASITALAGSVEKAANSIKTLESEVHNIAGILDVIRAIADQTNLLALNAAIEAARAGEQGRGFAVVADEVRSLAQRTQESTEEIQTMIEQLESEAKGAVAVILAGRDEAETSVSRATEAGQTLGEITEDILRIADMNTQVASATEEQSATVEMISEHVNNINSAFEETAGGTEEVCAAGVELQRVAEGLEKELSHFKV
ncbi:methyl-accepting chemotaxis protein [Motiliproteus sp. SC1-56]|uniref:methyl-accepting chemotaxis protein n=1 Tax=Motiliproteus sp. SC1-56 TaxID=2799565 RepID=UPI001A8D087F|nr:methyl-accepting chemotaxis protein [Motiliproteus sp. SC1-56]